MNDLVSLRSAMASEKLLAFVDNQDPDRVLRALGVRRKTARELALFLSPGADTVLEEMAQVARRITLERFGRTIGLYVPLYLSNHCVGSCPYCGFRSQEKIVRRTLTRDEIVKEVAIIRGFGMRDLLLVAGESPREVSIDYLRDAVSIARESVPSIAVEVAPLDRDGYESLIGAGAYGVTLYQETFDEARYKALHKSGPKADYGWRLASLDRAGAAGMRKLTTGALLGLAPWRVEGLRVGLHAAYLAQRWWKSQVAVGLPRLHNAPDDFEIAHRLSDRDLVQLIVALRIFSEDLGIAISTREAPALRNNLLPLGVTNMSAGSSTEPGGYSEGGDSGCQFEVADCRPAEVVAASIETLGFDPVWKDWDYSFGWRNR